MKMKTKKNGPMFSRKPVLEDWFKFIDQMCVCVYVYVYFNI